MTKYKQVNKSQRRGNFIKGPLTDFRTGIDEKVTEAGDKLAGVIGKRNVDKLGDIAMTSFGYSDSETCLCCPCLPASQVNLIT